jgi:ATPase subunit of ABC transporter with duplicated ATPase domains
MSRGFLKFHNVYFQYNGAENHLFTGLNLHAHYGWSGIIGANGAGKSTLIKLATGVLEPGSGRIDAPQRKVYCAQRTDDPPQGFEEFNSDFSKSANILRDRLAIQLDWLYRWSTLSHGERKRAQTAVALWWEPELLAIDEPFNHLDHEARHMIADALNLFQGIGLLIAHDRAILDRLCYQSLFIDPPMVYIRPGGYTKAMKTIDDEIAALHKKRELEKREFKRLKKEAHRRRQVADAAHGRVSKKNIDKKDHDAKSKKDLARLTGKDGIAGKLKQRMDNRLNQAQQQIDQIKVKKEYDLGIWFPEAISRRNRLFDIPAGSMMLGENRHLSYPQLAMAPSDRVALTGANGSGKSTLVRSIMETLSIPNQHLTYVPQEISKEESRAIIKEVKELPNEPLGFLMTAVRRLGSDPKQLLFTSTPSPGEIRKLLLALGLMRKPHLIIMDEPTNHMDLPSIKCLEQALTACPCGLLLISHDQQFLQALTTIQWHISKACISIRSVI